MSFYKRQFRPKRIAVDLDEVIVPMLTPMSIFANKKISRAKNYNYSELLDISPDASKQLVHNYYESGMFMSQEPLDNCKEILTEIKNQGHDIHIVTGRQNYAKDKTFEWLDKKLPNIIDDVHFTNSFSLDDKPYIPKEDICNDIKADYMLDDIPSTLYDIKSNSSTIPLLFGNYSWNNNNKLFKRIRTWNYFMIDCFNKLI